MHTLQILNDIASQRFYRTCQLPSVQDNEVYRLITSLLWMFRKSFTMSSSRACPNMPLFGAPVRDSEGSHLARIARSLRLNPIEATGMRLEVRRSRSSRSSNLFPLPLTSPQTKNLDAQRRMNVSFRGALVQLNRIDEKESEKDIQKLFSSFQEWVLVH